MTLEEIKKRMKQGDIRGNDIVEIIEWLERHIHEYLITEDKIKRVKKTGKARSRNEKNDV